MRFMFLHAMHVVLLFDQVELKQSDSVKPELGAPRDMRSVHMFKLYDQFNKERQSHWDQNTVRSFQALPVSANTNVVFHFNLTSIPESEVILSASLHFLKQHSRPLSCRRSRGPSCHKQHLLASVKLVFRGLSRSATFPAYLGNITLNPHKKGHWQTSDVSSVVQWARARNELLLSLELDAGEKMQDRVPPPILPYILVFANDLAINEPNSIATSLQRYSPVGEERANRPPLVTPSSRIRREAEHSQNYLPDLQYDDDKNKELWYNTYFDLKPKTSSKSHGARQGPGIQTGGSMTRELSFDKRTMKKARRKQWSEPRACARRYLRVDFADIGWSEWILAPKAFDAYYCAGTCGFPMPKVVHPSNHATIQSIVRAVGIVPGVPEPCCVPQKMSELTVLFLDANRNLVLKLYPSMSVETCACR